MGILLALLIMLSMLGMVVAVVLLVVRLFTRRKNAAGKIFLYSGLTFVVSAIILGMGTEEVEETPEEVVAREESEEVPTEESETAIEETTEGPVDVIIGLNTPLQVGDAEFTVTGVRTAESVSGEYFTEEAQGVFLILSVVYKNLGNEAATIDSSYFTLKYGEKMYDADNEANTSVHNKANLLYEQVNPDMSLSGDVVFDVTEEVANATNLQVQVQTGFWGTETGLINLQ